MTRLLVLKAFLISAMAAVGGAWISTVLLFGGSTGWMAPLLFTIPGATILSSAYGVARTYHPSGWTTYPFVLLVGAVVGGMTLVWSRLPGFAVGAGYGAITALCWITLHFIARPWRTRAYTTNGVTHA